MNDQDLQSKIQELSDKVDAVYVSVEKTRKYFLIICVVTVATVVLPLIGLIFAVPSFLSSYSALGGL